MNQNKKSKSFFKQSKTTFWLFIVVVFVSLMCPYFDKRYNWFITIPGLFLLALPYLRFSQYRHARFRLLNLSSILLFILIFGFVDKVSTYSFTLVALGIWFTTKLKTRWNDRILSFITIFFLYLPNICEKYIQNEFMLGLLMVIPSLFLWFQIIFELVSYNFGYENKLEEILTPPLPNQRIDLVLPMYNPHLGFEEIIEKYYLELCESFPQRSIRLLITNDGSKTNFGEEQITRLRQISPHLVIVDNPVNKGKGYALRKCIEQTTAPLVIYTDYDFPFTLESMVGVIRSLDEGSDIVIATRDHSYQGILPVLRKLYSTCSHYMNSFFLGLKYNDTQGGLKGFNLTGKKYILSTEINEFLFDTEFIYRASLDSSVHISNIIASTRKGIKPTNMRFKVIYKEVLNFIKLLKI